MNMMKLLLLVLLAAQLSLMPVQSLLINKDSDNGGNSEAQKSEQIDLAKWGIYKDGTHPVETTKGINNALKWANQNGKTSASLPSGTYLIDKNSRIEMVSNMLFELPMDAVLKKETNDKESYQLMYIGYGIHHVTLKGGTYYGDKEKHDYSKKDNKYSSGTHEGGYGIMTAGATDVTIDGVKAVNFTGDGLILGGYGTMIQDLYENHFVSGEFDNKGKNISNAKKIRTKNPIPLNNVIFKTEREFELSNAQKLPSSFDLFFYKADSTFISKLANRKLRDKLTIPAGATQFNLVFNQATKDKAYVEVWNRKATQNVTVKNSEFAFNRRQGITVGGADQVLISNNSLHDMKGTAPQAGIDVEGGFEVNGYLNTNVVISDNEFYNNAAYDVVLFDGHDAVVDNNHLASKGAIGLAISQPFKGATVTNNHFDGSRLIAAHDAAFIGNKMNDSYTTLEGPNIQIDGMEFTDSVLGISSKVPFGISVSNVTMYNNKKSDSGLSIWKEPIHLKDVTIIGESKLRSIVGGVAEGSIFDNLKVIGFNTFYDLSLPPGTYNGCQFEGAEGGNNGVLSLSASGKYVFDHCTFKPPASGGASLLGNHPNLVLTVQNSTFEIQGNTQAISIQAAKSALVENNTINANALTNTSVELLRIGDYWKQKEKHRVLKAVIRGNTFNTNLAAIGISTIYAGTSAPVYLIENNTLYTAKLALKKNDKDQNNVLK
ncbi:hypothetical protein FHS15_000054 [Paenibacillus castaneae]|uniref:right-handed parallel beta-helix repeat-containing protein n=1 Tax=Paenibacillus castaneae TaxID=474957 RepID=UPI000C9B189E|nr:right-handed parallel beta-helix repeat-containing protein [Paenibacillus castaneae]NIK74956.1 hypothetical protein [Paenibacillus castaneae]